MKDQYFGDVNDYRKYGLLRALVESSQLRLGVCWLRTANDSRRDGEFRRYLQRPQQWRQYDPDLYDALRRLLDPGVARSVLAAETWNLLPDATYHHRVLTDAADDRRSYFTELWERTRGVELLFVDPDNGMEVPSVRYGGRNSAKYVYWPEIEEAYRRRYSLVIYQHFRREKRDVFVRRIENELRDHLGGVPVGSFHTAHVLFLVAARPEHLDRVHRAANSVLRRWNGQIHADRTVL